MVLLLLIVSRECQFYHSYHLYRPFMSQVSLNSTKCTLITFSNINTEHQRSNTGTSSHRRRCLIRFECTTVDEHDDFANNHRHKIVLLDTSISVPHDNLVSIRSLSSLHKNGVQLDLEIYSFGYQVLPKRAAKTSHGVVWESSGNFEIHRSKRTQLWHRHFLTWM